MSVIDKSMWPALPYNEWRDTLDTLHMWMEIVGKVKLELAPFTNQWWEVAFQVSASGITTGEIPYRGKMFQIDFNFLEHSLTIQTSWGKSKVLPLTSQSVASFYKTFMGASEQLGIQVTIWPVPVEVANHIPFIKDSQHKVYDKKFVEKWWEILVGVEILFKQYRTSFRGKSSPIHFFWGSFDLNGTRFSGRRAKPPVMKGPMGKIMRYSENEENFAFGFWPGDEKFPLAAFYAYLYPKPEGMEAIKLLGGASFNEQLGECILPYEAVRKSKNPEKEIRQFLESSYQKSATLAGWNIHSFQTDVPTIRYHLP